MKYSIEVKKSILPDRIQILSSNVKSKYEVITKKFSVGRQITIKDAQSNEQITIKESALSFSPKYQILKKEGIITEISGTPKNEISSYLINNINFTIKGNMKKMNFTIFGDSQKPIGIVSKKKNKCYEVDIEDSDDELLILAISLSAYCLNTTDEMVYGGAAF